MKPMNLEQLVRNVDRRLERVEQFLPTLVTKDEFEQRVATLVTKEEFERRIATLVTKEEFEQRVATLATKDDLRPLATKEELREEFERSRRHTQVLFESLIDRISIVSDGFAATDVKINRELRPRLDSHERRITALENARDPAEIRRRR